MLAAPYTPNQLIRLLGRDAAARHLEQRTVYQAQLRAQGLTNRIEERRLLAQYDTEYIGTHTSVDMRERSKETLAPSAGQASATTPAMAPLVVIGGLVVVLLVALAVWRWRA